MNRNHVQKDALKEVNSKANRSILRTESVWRFGEFSVQMKQRSQNILDRVEFPSSLFDPVHKRVRTEIQSPPIPFDKSFNGVIQRTIE